MGSSQTAITQWGWAFHTLRGGIDPGDLRFRRGVVGVVDTWKDSDPEMGVYPPRSTLALCRIPSESAIGQWDWGFNSVRDCFGPGDLHFRLHVVGDVKVLEGFLTRGWESILPGVC